MWLKHLVAAALVIVLSLLAVIVLAGTVFS